MENEGRRVSSRAEPPRSTPHVQPENLRTSGLPSRGFRSREIQVGLRRVPESVGGDGSAQSVAQGVRGRRRAVVGGQTTVKTRQKTNSFCGPCKKGRSDTLEARQRETGERIVGGRAPRYQQYPVCRSPTRCVCEFTRNDVLNVRRRRTSANTANIFRGATRCRNGTSIRIHRQDNDLRKLNNPNSGAEGYRFEPCRA